MVKEKYNFSVLLKKTKTLMFADIKVFLLLEKKENMLRHYIVKFYKAPLSCPISIFCLEGHFTEPYEQNTQHSFALGFTISLQLLHL